MKAKYTQGPWRVVNYQDKNDVPRVVSDKGGIAVLCINRYHGEAGPSKQEQINAALIAAAPELLEALKDACEWLDSCPLGEEPRKAVIRYRAAISKATGE